MSAGEVQPGSRSPRLARIFAWNDGQGAHRSSHQEASLARTRKWLGGGRRKRGGSPSFAMWILKMAISRPSCISGSSSSS